MMSRMLSAGLLLSFVVAPVGGQQTPRAQFDVPGPGEAVPEVTVFDDSGREFSLRELRGEYSVLVFGCLT